jgi:hypothetical protein
MIPNKISQTFLDRQAKPDETVALVVRANGSGLGTYTVQGRTNKTFAFQFNKKAGGHILRFPASFWSASKDAVARELFDRNLPVALVPTVEPWNPSLALCELTTVPREEVPAEAPPIVPGNDLAPGGNGLVPVIPVTDDDIAAARVEGRNDFGSGLTLGDNPFTDALPELAEAWKGSFEAAESDANEQPDPPADLTDPQPEPTPEPTPEDQPADPAPAAYELRDGDIFRAGTEERVGGLFDPEDHLRMGHGLKGEREAVLAWLATLPPRTSTPPTE